MLQKALSYFQKHLDLRTVVAVSFLLRVVLICYGEWQDRYFAVKFTDVDYHVFSDAAKYVVEGKSPFLRPTYRYTPLLAIFLTPNHYLFFSFGKCLFVACDLLAAWVIYQIQSLQGIGDTLRIVSCSVWLMNPLTATVSVRGNAESLLAVLVLLTFYFAMHKYVMLSAIFYGLAVHVRIFPLVYALPMFLLLDENYCDPSPHPTVRRRSCLKFFNYWRMKFTAVSILTFLTITCLLYLRYGDEFIQEAYLYHITRRDTRHNFSVYFYMLYLIQDTWLSSPVGIIAFVPQAALLMATSLLLYRDITFCCFVQTFAFVTFNKVCTSQYFLWYLCLLPLIIPFSRLKLSHATAMVILWFLGQGLWLAPAYYLEFQGYNTFILIWLAGLLFFLVNVYILARIIGNHHFSPTFVRGQVSLYPWQYKEA